MHLIRINRCLFYCSSVARSLIRHTNSFPPHFTVALEGEREMLCDQFVDICNNVNKHGDQAKVEYTKLSCGSNVIQMHRLIAVQSGVYSLSIYILLTSDSIEFFISQCRGKTTTVITIIIKIRTTVSRLQSEQLGPIGSYVIEKNFHFFMSIFLHINGFIYIKSIISKSIIDLLLNGPLEKYSSKMVV